MKTRYLFACAALAACCALVFVSWRIISPAPKRAYIEDTPADSVPDRIKTAHDALLSGDKETALKIASPFANAGYTPAQNLLGDIYGSGEGGKPDFAQAIHWYRKAAEQGNETAQVNLGSLYCEGRVVPRDYSECLKWNRKAAENGNPMAQYNLGVEYFNGEALSRDYVESWKWLSVSSRRFALAADARRKVESRMNSSEVHQAERRLAQFLATAPRRKYSEFSVPAVPLREICALPEKPSRGAEEELLSREVPAVVPAVKPPQITALAYPETAFVPAAEKPAPARPAAPQPLRIASLKFLTGQAAPPVKIPAKKPVIEIASLKFAEAPTKPQIIKPAIPPSNNIVIAAATVPVSAEPAQTAATSARRLQIASVAFLPPAPRKPKLEIASLRIIAAKPPERKPAAPETAVEKNAPAPGPKQAAPKPHGTAPSEKPVAPARRPELKIASLKFSPQPPHTAELKIAALSFAAAPAHPPSKPKVSIASLAFFPTPAPKPAPVQKPQESAKPRAAAPEIKPPAQTPVEKPAQPPAKTGPYAKLKTLLAQELAGRPDAVAQLKLPAPEPLIRWNNRPSSSTLAQVPREPEPRAAKAPAPAKPAEKLPKEEAGAKAKHKSELKTASPVRKTAETSAVKKRGNTEKTVSEKTPQASPQPRQNIPLKPVPRPQASPAETRQAAEPPAAGNIRRSVSSAYDDPLTRAAVEAARKPPAAFASPAPRAEKPEKKAEQYSSRTAEPAESAHPAQPPAAANIPASSGGQAEEAVAIFTNKGAAGKTVSAHASARQTGAAQFTARSGIAAARAAFARKDYARAVAAALPPAQAGDADSQELLGDIYLEGLGTRPDPGEAYSWYRKAASGGARKAQYAIGMMYYRGEPVPKDETQALRWLRKAASAGQAQAQARLAAMYLDGEGNISDQEGAPLLEKAAEYGDTRAALALGMNYENAVGVPHDPVAALSWYLAAAKSRNKKTAESARRLSAALMKTLTAAQIAAARALCARR